MTLASPTPPKKLGDHGKELWESIIPAYELRPDELRILIDACREADLIGRLEDELIDAPLMVKGSMGQLVASPLVSEVRQHRAVLAGLLAKIKIPDTPSGVQRKAAKTSADRSKAARARWGTGAGKVS
jgi:hypothetical protein